MKKISGILFLFLIAVVAVTSGQSIDKIIQTAPNPPKLVNDYANILTADQRDALERKLYQFDDSTSSQVVVVIVSSLEGKDVADAAIDIGRNWGVGSKKNNNGVVLLVAVQDRKLNISPGYGLEKALPDLTCQQIIQDIIVPNFKGNDYYRGIEEGTDAMIQAIKGEYKAPENYRKKGKSDFPVQFIFFIILLLILFAITGGRGGRGGGGGSFMSRRGAMPFIIGDILGGMGRGGGGGGSSSSGGGFGGFGGGSFGGGGSSGSW